MSLNFVRLILIWLLPLTGSSTVTSGPHHNSTNVMTGNTGQKFNEDHVTAQRGSSLSAFSEVIQSIMMDANTTEQTTTRPSTKPSPLQTNNKQTFLPSTPTAATQNVSISSQNNSSTAGIKSTTEVQLKFITSETTEVTSPASIPTTTTTRAPLIQTAPVTSPFSHFTKAKKKQDLPKDMGTYYNKVVAGLIGGALVMMMVGFLVIYVKKRKLQRQQMTTRAWAGPSPFIEGGADDGPVTLRASNPISLSRFLPQRLSKRLSLIPGIDEQFKDMTSTTTFGDKYQETMSGRELCGNNVQRGKGTTIVVPEMKSRGDIPVSQKFEKSVSLSTSQENDLQCRDNDSEETNLSEDQPANPTSPPGAVETE